MLLSEMLRCRVFDRNGAVLGNVVDVRFRRGARDGSKEGALELIALIVSPRSRGSFYGYERGRMHGPAVIAWIVRRLHRGSRIIPWECIERIDEGEVHVGVDLPVIPLDVQAPIGD